MADDNKLTLSDANTLATLIAGVQKGQRATWFPNGEPGDKTCDGVLRCFAHEGGGFLTSDDDVRDQYIHVSGMLEYWLPVRDVMSWVEAGMFAIG